MESGIVLESVGSWAFHCCDEGSGHGHRNRCILSGLGGTLCGHPDRWTVIRRGAHCRKLTHILHLRLSTRRPAKAQPTTRLTCAIGFPFHSCRCWYHHCSSSLAATSRGITVLYDWVCLRPSFFSIRKFQ